MKPAAAGIAMFLLSASVLAQRPSDPALLVPVSTTFTFVAPAAIDAGEQFAGVAGGGALSCATRQAQELVASQYSWMVHSVMASAGSTLTNE